MTETNRDELALLIDPNALELEAYPWPRNAADRVLNSDWLRKVKADAWEEAVISVQYDEILGGLDYPLNPYRD